MLRMGISKSQIGAMVVNGLLILFGILMIALAFHLINEHHMSSLYFLSSWLYTFPMTLIVLGMFNVVIALAAIIAASIRNKYGLIVCAIFVLLLVLPQFFSIWAANKVKEDTDEKAFLQQLFTVLKKGRASEFILYSSFVGEIEQPHRGGDKEE